MPPTPIDWMISYGPRRLPRVRVPWRSAAHYNTRSYQSLFTPAALQVAGSGSSVISRQSRSAAVAAIRRSPRWESGTLIFRRSETSTFLVRGSAARVQRGSADLESARVHAAGSGADGDPRLPRAVHLPAHAPDLPRLQPVDFAGGLLTRRPAGLLRLREWWRRRSSPGELLREAQLEHRLVARPGLEQVGRRILAVELRVEAADLDLTELAAVVGGPRLEGLLAGAILGGRFQGEPQDASRFSTARASASERSRRCPGSVTPPTLILKNRPPVRT